MLPAGAATGLLTDPVKARKGQHLHLGSDYVTNNEVIEISGHWPYRHERQDIAVMADQPCRLARLINMLVKPGEPHRALTVIGILGLRVVRDVTNLGNFRHSLSKG